MPPLTISAICCRSITPPSRCDSKHTGLARCSEISAYSGVCESFELLFGLLSHIDEGNDDVLFFADDGSSLDVGVNWRTALPAYFNCLAETSSPEEFAQTVDFSIEAFSPYDRPRYLTVARNVANDAQRIALDALM